MYVTLCATVYALIYITMYVTMYATSHGTVYATIYVTLSVKMYVTVYVIIYLTLCIAVYVTLYAMVYINVREYRRSTSNQKSTTRETGNIGYTRKKKQNKNTICGGHHYAQANTKNANKIRTLLQTTASETNRTSLFLNGNRNGQHSTKLRT